MMKKINALIKKEGNKATIIASDESVDRHGDSLKIDLWDLKQYKKAPRLMVDHDHRVEKIVGKAVDIRVENKQLLFEPDFHRITELSQAVSEMFEKDYLNSVSVGFIPHYDEQGKPERYELIEISFVTVGANRNALAKAFETETEADKVEEINKYLDETVDKCSCDNCTKSDTISSDPDYKKLYEVEFEKNSNLMVKIAELEALCEKQQQTLTEHKQKGVQPDKQKQIKLLKGIAQNVNRILQEQKKD